jgi:ADP-heptose:LPS heptosyltransferase
VIQPIGDKVLLLHLGGLGDVCLSESTFLSLSRRFPEGLAAVGYTRFLELFQGYFSSIHSIDGREWLYLFSDHVEGPAWNRIILIGKDRSGSFANRLVRFSREDFLFVDMYPEGGSLHVREYQLTQLGTLGVDPAVKSGRRLSGDALILYPEKGYHKQKWPYEKFLEVYDHLLQEGVSTLLLEPFDTEFPHKNSFRFNRLSDLRSFLETAGTFVSNDCGVAHLAATCGLATITLFHEADPAIWHPLGNNHSIRCSFNSPSVEELVDTIMKTMSGKR